MSNELKVIGDAVKLERLRRRMSIEAAAEAAHMSHMTWRRIEHGKNVQERSRVAALLSLGMSPDGAPQDALEAEATVIGDLVWTSVRAGRMRVLAVFGVNAA